MADYEGRLNIAVTSDGVDKAKKSLSDLTKAGAGAEKATDGLAKSTRQAGNEMDRASKDAQSLAKQTEQIGISAKQTTSALRQVPAQFTDIVVSLQGGQAPLQVLLQQGGQLKDLFGGVGNAAQALGGYIAGLVTPVNLSIAAVVGLGVAAKSAYDQISEFNVVLQNTGSIAAGSPVELRKVGVEIGNVTGLYGDAKSAVLALANTGQISYKNIADAARTATLASEFLGRSVEDTAADFVALQKDPVKAIVKLNEAMNFLTLEQFKQIASLKEQGKEQDAVNLAFKLYQDAISKGAGNVAKDLNVIEEAWFRVKTGASSALQSVQDFFAPLTDEQKLNKAKEQLQSYIKVANTFPKGSLLGNAAQSDVDRQQAVVDGLQLEIDKRREADKAKADSAIKQKQLIADEIKAEEERKRQREESLRLAEQQQRQREREAQQRAQYLQGITDEIALIKAQDALIRSGTGVQDARTIAQLRANNVSESTIKSLVTARSQHEQLLETLKKEESFHAQYEKSLESQQIAVDKQIETIVKNAEAINAEVENYGKLPSAITDVTIARKEDQRTIIDGLGLSTENIDKEIEALKRLRDAQSRKEITEANRKAEQERVRETEKANEQSQRDYERTYESIQKSLTDALLRGFESGKSFAENFRSTLINMFKTLVLTPAINFILSPITNAVAQGVAGTANQGITSTAGSIFKNLSNVFTSTNNSIIGGIADIGATIADGMGGIRDTIGGFIGANAASIANGLSYAGAVLQLSQGNLAGAALTAVGTYFGGPIGGAIGGAIGSAIGGLFGKKKSTPRYSSGVTGSFFDGTFTSTSTSGISGFKGNAGGQEGLTAAASVFSTSLDKLLRSYGIKAQIDTSLQFYKRKGAWGAAQISVGGVQTSITGGDSVYSKDAQTAFNNLINQFLTQGFSNAVKASTLPEGLKNLFDGITDTTQMNNMLSAVIKLSTAQDELASRFGLTASQAGFVAQQSGLAGDELTAFVNSLSDAGLASATVGEQMVKFRNSLTDVVGGTLFDNLDAFDAALKGIDKTTEEGIARFYELFSIRDEFQTFTNSVDTLKGNVKSALLGIVSDSEQQSMLQSDLADMFDSLNLAMPATIDELIALGKSIDYTTESGLTLAASFPALVQAFTQTQQVIADLTKTTDDFATQFEYLRYQALAKNYGTSFANNFVPSFAVGTNYVPADGLAMIHQGERIIPAADNQTLMQNSADMVQAIRDLRSDVNNLNAAMQSAAINTAKSAKSLDNIERGGVIISDIGIDGNEQILKVEVVA